MAFVRIIIAYALSVAAATFLASLFHTQMVICGLTNAGAEIAGSTRLDMTVDDFFGLAPQLGAVIAIGFAIAFVIAALLRRAAPPLAGVAFPIAGAIAVGVALLAMSLAFDGITPIAGARTPLGFALECLAGAVGGMVFGAIAGLKRV